MPIAIVHIGLPLDDPRIPPEERPKIARRLALLQQDMRAAGYRYDILYASPPTGLDGFLRHLREHPCDGVLIGGGVAADPALAGFLRQIIAATQEAAPHARVLLYDHSVAVRTLVERSLFAVEAATPLKRLP